MQWFRNAPVATGADGFVSADYSLQAKMGIANYQAWKGYQPESVETAPVTFATPPKSVSVRLMRNKYREEEEAAQITEPVMDYTKTG
ncbi:hypothetical protein QFC22_000659 [Naganishia vaughanmartiniae]|uniref:Uncharacterized protein n=1 Tax=Naganishia vaughanmartiniae TaxID=1424756 RepID=A0ACC2XRR8_9TREE|nr:hypothetical protein QFC22_000659 [Naganishia vaughanmartiniae]